VRDRLRWRRICQPRRIGNHYGKACAVPLALKSENSYVSASQWLLTQTALRHSEDAAGVPVAVTIATVVAAVRGEAVRPAASRLRRGGQAWLERPWLARVPRVLYREWARMVSAGSPLAGSPCRCGRLGDL
jgi:hypothetical protein